MPRSRAAARVRHHADPDAAHARNRRWNAQNPARRNAANARWRGVPLMAEGKDFVAIIRHDLCAYCSEDGGTVDHIDPVARGGDGDTMNLTGACARCNREKHATPLLAFLLRRLG